ncbi:MAG: fibronectin type III domain-containing protein [Opitutales bacterium]
MRLTLGILLLLVTGPLAGHPGHDEPVLRHWETASPDPDRIVLTWAGDPATSIAVNWRTDPSVSQAYAEIAPATADPRFDLARRQVAATTEPLDLNTAYRNSQGRVHYHSATFTGLEPDTLYAYRVGDGADRWSEWIQFRTAAVSPEPFSFLYFGDAQNAVFSHWSRVIRAAYSRAPEAAFSLHAGDLVNRAHRDREWAEWFTAGGWIHASVPSIVVAGNHEYDEPDEAQEEPKVLALQWRPQFTLPVEAELPEDLHETVYSIDYQGARFIVLNSNRHAEAQAAWLEAVLAANPHRWTIVSFHHPVFSSGRGRDNAERRSLLKPIFDKHGVDLVLQGHDHTYARGQVPVRMTDGTARVRPDGSTEVTSMYVNSVSGPKMYQFQEDGWDVYAPDGVELARKAENTQFFQVIAIEGNILRYRAFTATGDPYDAFMLTKAPDGTKTLHDTLQVERTFENTGPYSREDY